jgi:hypothetical protein
MKVVCSQQDAVGRCPRAWWWKLHVGLQDEGRPIGGIKGEVIPVQDAGFRSAGEDEGVQSPGVWSCGVRSFRCQISKMKVCRQHDEGVQSAR